MTDDEIADAAVALWLERDRAAGRPDTAGPEVMEGLARIVESAAARQERTEDQ